MDAARFLASYEAEQPGFRVPDSLADRFTLISCLKYAPGGQVYLLTGADGKPYILRVAPAEALDRLLREHLTLRMLHDPAFPHPVACFREGNGAYLIREYIPGTPLSELVENGDPMPPARAVKYAREICAILSKLHALNPPVIHRDIKPHNFILTPEGKLCLVDLDAASEYRPDSWLDTVVLGTAATAAPEQFGYRRCDMRTDVYGVGMVLVFLMTGDFDLRAFFRSHISRAPKRIVKKCVRFDPEMRYSSMEQLSRALARWQHGRRRVPVAAALILVLALIASGAYANRRAIWSAAANYAATAAQEDYAFYSPLVESAVRVQLDRPTGRITKADLRNVERLYICGDQAYGDGGQMAYQGTDCYLYGERYAGYGDVGSLADLSNMPNLREVGLSRLRISDLTPLIGHRLDFLALCGNDIENLDVISRLDTVYSLYMADNPLVSLEGIEGMLNLRDLDISATRVTDLSPLASTQLDTLKAFDMPDDIDLSALSSISTIRRLLLRGVSPAKCSFLAGMTELTSLTLFYSGVTDFSFLKNMVNLRDLCVAGNPGGSLEALSGLVNLQSLSAESCELKSLSGIENLPNLVELNVGSNPSADLSLLDSLPALNRLGLTRDMEDHLPRPADEYPFEIIWED